MGTRGGFYGRQIRDLQPRGRNGRGRKRKEKSVTRSARPDTTKRVRASYGRMVTRRACFGAEAAVASAGSPRRRASTASRKIAPTSRRRKRDARRERARGGKGGIASWRVRTSARLAGVIYSFLAWRGERAAEPGRCQREGSNDDLYPLLPVLLPTRDNTNHYHRLITGITANIEIMYACVCVYVHACARASRRTDQRVCVRMYFTSPGPAKGVAPSLISSSPPTLFLASSSLVWQVRRRVAFNDVAGIIRDTGRGQVRCEPAKAERSAAYAAGDLPERSLDGRKAGEEGGVQREGAEGSLRREGIPRTREAGRLPPLENPSSLFCANSSTLGRGSLLEELADARAQGRFISAELSRVSKIFHRKPTTRESSPSSLRFSARENTRCQR